MQGPGRLESGARALVWYLRWARCGGEGLTDDEIHAVLGADAPAALIRGVLRDRADLVGCRLTSDPIEEVPGRVVADAVLADGARMRAIAVVRADRYIHVMIAKALPQGLTIREASHDDGPRLAELCRRCPIVVGESRTTIDYGEDYLHATEVPEDRLVLVAERDGRVVGLHGCVLHEGFFGDDQRLLAYLRHTRVDPDAQGAGLFSALNGALFERNFAEGAHAYSLVVVGNAKMLAKLPAELRGWPWLHSRFLFDTRRLADSSIPLETVDPARAAELVNLAHLGAAISQPMTAESMQRRTLGVMYGPDAVLGNDRAAIGVSRRRFTMTTDEPGGARTRVETVALDVGATSVKAFRDVLCACCARLADDGIDDLVIDLPSGSHLHDPIAEFAHSTRTYALQMAIPPPSGATGFRVDPAYI